MTWQSASISGMRFLPGSVHFPDVHVPGGGELHSGDRPRSAHALPKCEGLLLHVVEEMHGYDVVRLHLLHFFYKTRPPVSVPLFPYPTLFRSPARESWSPHR